MTTHTDLVIFGVPVDEMGREQLIEVVVWLMHGKLEQFERLGIDTGDFTKKLRQPDLSLFYEDNLK